MTAKTRGELNTDADTSLADNETGLISETDVRQIVKDVADSAVNHRDSAGKAALEAAGAPADVGAIRLHGYAAAGDGGGALYRRVGSEPAHPGKIQSADGAWWELAETRPTPQMFGALADGSNDNSEAVNRCGAFVNAKGLGLLYIPDGTYRIGTSATGTAAQPDEGFTGVIIYDGMTIRGQSRDKTILKSVDTVGRHLIIPVTGVVSYQIESLTLDGNKATHALSVHGIRLHSENKDVRIHNVLSRDNGGYGIGVAYDETTPLTNLNLHVSDCIIENNDEDGFDCKISERAFLDRVVSRNNAKSGIDVRGHYVVTSDCLAHGNGTWGISSGRPTSDASGIAHHQSINCIAHDNVQMGFRFRDGADTTAEISEHRVTNALSYSNTGAGMGIICGRGTVVINGGAIYENGSSGISITDVAGGYTDPENLHVEVIGTTIRDNTSHGISGGADFPARLAVVGGRIAVAAAQRAIDGSFRSLRCSGVRFEGGEYGVVWSNSVAATEDGEISGCVFTGQTQWGVSVATNATGVVTGCTFRGANGFRTLSGALDWLVANNEFSGVSGTSFTDASGTVLFKNPENGSLTVADDTAVAIPIGGAGGSTTGLIILWCETNPGFGASPNGTIRFRVGTSAILSVVALVNQTDLTLSTGELLGTTGVDGVMTISAHTDKNIYIENRIGSSRVVHYELLYR